MDFYSQSEYGNMITIEKTVNVTSSQIMFLYWLDISGGTNLSSSVKIVSDHLSETDFKSAYKIFKKMHIPLNVGWEVDGVLYGDATCHLLEDSSDSFYFSNKSTDNDFDLGKESSLLLNERFSPDEGVHHRLNVYEYSDNVYYIVLVCDHLIIDGLGANVLMNNYLCVLNDITTDNETPDVRERELDTYNSEIMRQNNYEYGDVDKAAYEEYMRSASSIRMQWNPCDKRMKNAIGNYKTKEIVIEKNDLESLSEKTKSKSISLFSLLIDGFTRSLESVSLDNDNLLLQIPTHGRSVGNSLLDDSVVGCFSQAVPMLINSDIFLAQEDDRVIKIDKRLKFLLTHHIDAVNSIKISQTLASHKQLRSKLRNDDFRCFIMENMPSNIYFSYYGNSSIKNEHSRISVKNIAIATTNNPGVLDVLGIMFNGELKFFFNYDSTYFTEEVIDKLSNNFKRIIENRQDAAPVEMSISSIVNVESRVKPLVLKAIDMYAAVTVDDMDMHLEIDLGIDSLSKMKLVSEIQRKLDAVDHYLLRDKLNSALTVGEVINAVTESSQKGV